MSKYSKNAPADSKNLKRHFGKLYNHIPDNADVLDFGCSTGYYGKLLQVQKKCTVDGIEIDKEDLAQAKKTLRNVFSFDLDSNTWPTKLMSKKYDILFFGDIIEHLKYPSDVLRKAKTLLKKNGKILISTPNIAHLSIRLELLSGNFEYERVGILDETHLKYFTLASLKHLLKDCGLSIVDIDYSIDDYPPDVIAKWLNNLGLKALPKFWKIINEPDARAFQYKIVAEASSEISGRTAKIENKPSTVRDRYVNELNQAWDNNKNLVKSNDALAKENHTLNEELTSIHNSRIWKTRKYLIRKKEKLFKSID